MSLNLRIHIVPVGYEFRRVTEPLIDMQADKVYLITHAEDDHVANFFSKIKEELANKYSHIHVCEVFLDVWDLYACIEKFREIISKEKGNHIHVNVSTGTKITAIAGMLSCMMWKAQPYYAPVSYQDRTIIDLPTEQVEKVTIFPTYGIKKPKPVYMQILNLLQQHGDIMRKSKLIEKLEDAHVIREVGDSGKMLTGSAKHSQLRSLLDPMEREWNLISVEASGRRSEVHITQQGKTALKIFGRDL